MRIKLLDVIVNERIREDAGDLSPLMESMLTHGLLNPITINRDYELLAGYRRLMAAKNLGWTDIECNMVSAKTDLKKLLIETEENTTRLDFTEDEIEKINQLKDYYSSRLFRFFIWCKNLWKRVVEFFKNLLKKNKK